MIYYEENKIITRKPKENKITIKIINNGKIIEEVVNLYDINTFITEAK